MSKPRQIKILGNGQIWDIKGVDPDNPEKIFEDLFSGRALGEMAREYEKKGTGRIFRAKKQKFCLSPFLITGHSVSRALVSKDKLAQQHAKQVLSDFSLNGARGIEHLTKGTAIKTKWSRRERDHWRNLSGVIIGGGVSEDATGRLIVKEIKKCLKSRHLGRINIYQAKFPGKESGFLGAVAYCLPYALKKSHREKNLALIGLDIGRADIGVGVSVFNAKTGKMILYKGNPWKFTQSKNTPYSSQLHIFKDSYKRYSKAEIALGKRIRNDLIDAIVQLIINAIKKIEKHKICCSKFVGIGLPGETDNAGYMIGSTHYLPFLEKQHGFHFAGAVKKRLEKLGAKGYNIQILNDGIAAGLANLRFGIGLDKLKRGKYAFLGPGSGLGGFVGEVTI